jgi:hypothetical protein
MRKALSAIGLLLTLVSLPGISDDLAIWRQWMSGTGEEIVGWALPLVGVTIILFANIPSLRVWDPSPLRAKPPNIPGSVYRTTCNVQGGKAYLTLSAQEGNLPVSVYCLVRPPGRGSQWIASKEFKYSIKAAGDEFQYVYPDDFAGSHALPLPAGEHEVSWISPFLEVKEIGSRCKFDPSRPHSSQ